MTIKTKSFFIVFLILISSSAQLIHANGPASSKDKDGSSVGTNIMIAAAVYLAVNYTDRGLTYAYYWLSGQESPAQKTDREEKEKNEREKINTSYLSAQALEARERVRVALLADGILTPQQNEEIKKKHAQILLASSKNHETQEKKESLQELLKAHPNGLPLKEFLKDEGKKDRNEERASLKAAIAA